MLLSQCVQRRKFSFAFSARNVEKKLSYLNASRIPPGQIEGPKYLNNYRPKFDEGDFSQILMATKWIGDLSGRDV